MRLSDDPNRVLPTVKPLMLDLFCGAGGCAVGYHRAGFRLVGIDLAEQLRYPYSFIRGDAVALLRGLLDGATLAVGDETLTIEDFAAIHASPPCQAYSSLRTLSPDKEYPDLVAPIREMLQESGLPYVIENVVRAPLHNPVILCGSIFDLGAATTQGWRQLRRHRAFECSFPILVPPCNHRGRAIGVHGGGPTTRKRTDGKGGRSYQGTLDEKSEAMDIWWMEQDELNEAIPPAYTEYIGNQLMRHVLTLRDAGVAA